MERRHRKDKKEHWKSFETQLEGLVSEHREQQKESEETIQTLKEENKRLSMFQLVVRTLRGKQRYDAKKISELEGKCAELNELLMKEKAATRTIIVKTMRDAELKTMEAHKLKKKMTKKKAELNEARKKVRANAELCCNQAGWC
jgi:hypothetical protein